MLECRIQGNTNRGDGRRVGLTEYPDDVTKNTRKRGSIYTHRREERQLDAGVAH